jgi:hypothetical protein
MYFSPTFWKDRKVWELLPPDPDRQTRAAFRNKQRHLLKPVGVLCDKKVIVL